MDGRSLVPLLRGGNARPTGARRRWSSTTGPTSAPDDPDLPAPGSGNPTTYEALRTANAVYVEYADGEREYYNLARDPNELHNTYGRLRAKSTRAPAQRPTGGPQLPQRQKLLGGAAARALSGAAFRSVRGWCAGVARGNNGGPKRRLWDFPL